MTGTPAWCGAFAGVECAAGRDGIESLRIDGGRWRDLVGAAWQAGFLRFVDLTAVDDPSRPERFEIVLTLYSPAERRWLRVRTTTAERLPSITATFAAADWYERELFDLFGVHFEGHPNLTRILLPDDHPTHPLRRDEPLGDVPIEFTVTREAEE